MTSVAKLTLALAFAGLAALTAAAQTNKTTLTVPTAASCPISLSARHGVDGSVIAVAGKAHHGIGQQLELTLNNPGNTAISAIWITVHGWNGSLHSLPARAINSNGTNASRTVQIKVPIAPHKTTNTSIWVSGLTSVDSMDLIEVRYARGLNWRASASHACRIVPDGEMLISHR